MAMLQVTDLKVNYGVIQAIKGVSFEVNEGEVIALIGANGAGKTTILHTVTGLIAPKSGKIEFEGKDITKMSSDELAVFRRSNCGFVFQQIYMLDKMSLLDNVLTAGLLINKNKKEILENAKELFEKVNLSEHTIRKNVNKVSGGEAQRAGIVRAAINSPICLFADEPTGALNSETGNAVLDVFTTLNNDGQSIIMVTHDKKSALRGNRIIYLKDGKIFGELKLDKYNGDSKERNDKLNMFLEDMGW